MSFKRYSRLVILGLFFSGAAAAQTFEETPDIVISPNFCSLYPLTVPNALVGQAQPDTAFNHVTLGTGPGNYSWLAWAGHTDANTLAQSLVPPGNSQTYRNPLDNGDGQLNIGDWVEGKPGVKKQPYGSRSNGRTVGPKYHSAGMGR